MPEKNLMPATDSARDLRNLMRDDVTADFETDPKFIGSNPAADGSSENLAALRDTDDEEESDDELEDDEIDEDEEYEDEDGDEDVDPEAELDDDDEEEEEFDDDDDEDEVDEDDEDEVGSSDPSRFVLKRAA